MNTVLSGLLLFTLLYLLFDVFVKFNSFGITPNAINLTLFGNEDEFVDAITKSSFLEFIHTEIFFIMMILLTLSAIFVRISKSFPFAALLTNITMTSALFSLIFLALAYFTSEVFVLLYVLTYFTWHLGALTMALYAFWKLNFAASI